MAIALDIHPFERAGLGNAPFRFMGISEKTYQACHGAPVQAAGTCDYCGQGIMYVFHVRSADGRAFGVGCDCIRKCDKESVLDDAIKADAVRQRAMRKAKRDEVHRKESKRIADALDVYDNRHDIQQAFAAMPHPAIPDKTYADYVDWMRKHAGASGNLRIARKIESMIA